MKCDGYQTICGHDAEFGWDGEEVVYCTDCYTHRSENEERGGVMTYLFKLKKDGKAVGYLKAGAVFTIQGIWFAEKRDGGSWQRCPKKIIEGDFDIIELIEEPK